ncbi:hypothetical protein BGZ96_005827 [Linnemannia gamsii]|uniref:Fibronectin type-III domain-containing protein n=1 Tax=Linnemannia gamsii TaxID=64522 RepID=A0ABQ7K528_9FUNG|nr:hypothetical protein BGZ96_005827 [Linnemannia gamsii]
MESDLLTNLPPGPATAPRTIEQKQHSTEQQQLQQQQQTSDQGSSRSEGTRAIGATSGAGAGVLEAEQAGSSSTAWPTALTTRFQDHLKLFFSMHHKLFDLVAFYVVMFALNGQITSLPTRLEWIGFCVQSIVALRRAFQTSIKHGLGLTSFLGMLDLLVGQLFLHQDRLGFLPTVANILVYFYVINLTRGLVFGDSVSCLLWFLFGLVDIYRRDLSSASILDLTPYKVIPVHTVGFGLYILMSELVDVMLHSAEPDQTQGRYLNYVGAQKEGPVSFRSTSRRATNQSTDNGNLRFELCITEITPFTVSFCLNALSEASVSEQQASPQDPKSTPSTPQPATIADENARILNETIDLSTIKVGSIVNTFSNSSSSTPRPPPNPASTPTPRIISTSDIVIHVNYIPWRQVQYHFPDEQSFTLFGLTPATDYEIEMKVHRFSSFIARVGTRAAPPGTPIPTATTFEKPVNKPIEPAPKNPKNRKSKRNQKAQRDNNSNNNNSSNDKSGPGSGGGDGGKSKFTNTTTTTMVGSALPALATAASDALASLSQSSRSSDSLPLSDKLASASSVMEQKSANQLLLEQLQTSIQASVDTAAATRAIIKKLKRDQSKSEALLRQELEGIGRGQAKAALQDQKRRQKLSFLQESIKQTNAHAATLQDELREVKETTEVSQQSLVDSVDVVRTLELDVQAAQAHLKTEIAPIKVECQGLQAEMKRLEGERLDWASQTSQLQDGEVAPLQLRLQRLEQQQIVWKVAAKANKDKDREATLRVAALEEDIQKKNLKIQDLDATIQELKNSNVQLKEAVEKEMEIWESLEREFDLDDENQEDDHPPLTFSQDQLSSSSSLLSGTSTIGLQTPLHQFNHHHHLDMSIDPIYSDSFWFSSGNGTASSTAAVADLWQTSSLSAGTGKPLLPPLARLQSGDNGHTSTGSGARSEI